MNWEKIKREEKGIGSHSESIAKVPKSMPALLRAFKIQQRAKKAGFDWKDISGAIEKLEEEQNELLEEIKKDDKSGIEEELGDLLFSVVNVSRFLKVDPEISLNKTCDKFIKRFSYVEKIVNTRYNKQLEVLSLEELDEIWEESKNADIKIWGMASINPHFGIFYRNQFGIKNEWNLKFC